MRIHQTLLAVLLAAVSLPAAAGLLSPIDAYEAALGNTQLPQSSAGTIVVSNSACSTCTTLRFRVNAQTRYTADGQDYTLADFRSLMATVRDRAGTFLTIVHDRDTDAVVAIRVKL